MLLKRINSDAMPGGWGLYLLTRADTPHFFGGPFDLKQPLSSRGEPVQGRPLWGTFQQPPGPKPRVIRCLWRGGQMATWNPQGVDPGPSASWQLRSPWSGHRKENLGGLVLSLRGDCRPSVLHGRRGLP